MLGDWFFARSLATTATRIVAQEGRCRWSYWRCTVCARCTGWTTMVWRRTTLSYGCYMCEDKWYTYMLGVRGMWNIRMYTSSYRPSIHQVFCYLHHHWVLWVYVEVGGSNYLDAVYMTGHLEHITSHHTSVSLYLYLAASYIFMEDKIAPGDTHSNKSVTTTSFQGTCGCASDI